MRFQATALDEQNAPVKATIYFGDFEARVTPVADTDPATPLSVTARLTAGTYSFVAQADGYGMFRFSLQVVRGQNRTVRVQMATNWASSHKGAVAAGDGINLDKLIDDTETTNWARLGATPDVQDSQVTVKLAGGARQLLRVQVSAMLRPRDPADPGGDTGSQNRFSALRQFEIWACRESASVSCTGAQGFSRIFTSPPDAFPGAAPRPVAPDLNLRAWEVPATTATHVRLRVVANQCTGAAAFRGDQDLDPLNDSDCVSGSAQETNVRAAELQVFTQPSKAQ